MIRFLTEEDLEIMEHKAVTEEEVMIISRCREHLANGEMLTIDEKGKIQLFLKERFKEN